MAANGDTHRDEQQGNGPVNAAISTAVVRLTNQYTGRGPTKSKTYVNHDVITVFLQDTLTRGEQTLVAAGKTAHVLQTRKHFQNAMRDDLVSAVEQLTERRVIAFLSDNSVNPDFAVEAFVLESLQTE